MSNQLAEPIDVVSFWLEAGPQRWFEREDAFDESCRRFLPTYEAAARGELDTWQNAANDALALVLLLDQFPRNLFRGDAQTYATDAVAVRVADLAITNGFDHQVGSSLRRFFYLPFMHSENLEDQERSVVLNEALGDPDSIKFARHHHSVIARFGRFPHRNAILKRETTPEEEAFLAEDSFRG
jgi:uncharacterized protein (DUF924 family)